MILIFDDYKHQYKIISVSIRIWRNECRIHITLLFNYLRGKNPTNLYGFDTTGARLMLSVSRPEKTIQVSK